MSKAIISNRIYLTATGDVAANIRKELTYKINIKGANRGGKHTLVEVIKNYKSLPNNILSIPQGREDLIPEDYEIIDKRVKVDMPFPDPKVELRPEQRPVYEETNDSGFINALPGWGKTFTALHIARKLGQKTLIITHTTILRDQWIKEVEALFGIKAGIIGTGKFDIDHTIVVGNVQSVTKYSLEISKEFGTVIMDEGHHCPATTFTSIIDNMYSRYRIGLSGTMIRTDGKHILLRDYFGPIVHKPPQSHTMNPRIKIINSGVSLKAGEVWARKINALLYDEDYQQFIATLAAYQMSRGHKVLIVADRTEFLSNVKEILGEKCMLVIGETGEAERAGAAIEARIASGEISCIAGSRQIFSEGVSINPLSCLILASPISSPALLEQIIGRIIRMHPDKLDPLVLDIHFNGWADRKQNNARLAVYLDKGWEVESR
jgi:superfamily II DNA or RNA helicase